MAAGRAVSCRVIPVLPRRWWGLRVPLSRRCCCSCCRTSSRRSCCCMRCCCKAASAAATTTSAAWVLPCIAACGGVGCTHTAACTCTTAVVPVVMACCAGHATAAATAVAAAVAAEPSIKETAARIRCIIRRPLAVIRQHAVGACYEHKDRLCCCLGLWP